MNQRGVQTYDRLGDEYEQQKQRDDNGSKDEKLGR